MRISFLPAQVHLFLTYAGASHFYLRVLISFFVTHVHIIMGFSNKGCGMFTACGIWCLADVSSVCSDEGLTLEMSAKHHIPKATNIPYQPLLIKSIFSVLAHAKQQIFSKLVFYANINLAFAFAKLINF